MLIIPGGSKPVAIPSLPEGCQIAQSRLLRAGHVPVHPDTQPKDHGAASRKAAATRGKSGKSCGQVNEMGLECRQTMAEPGMVVKCQRLCLDPNLSATLSTDRLETRTEPHSPGNPLASVVINKPIAQ